MKKERNYAWMGYGAVLFTVLVCVLGPKLGNKTSAETDKVKKELNDFKNSQPNYIDSVRECDARIRAVKDSLAKDSLKMPKAKKEAFEQQLATEQAHRTQIENDAKALNTLLNQHLDSVRNANKNNFWVSKKDIQYTR